MSRVIFIALHQQRPNFGHNRPKTQQTTTEITNRHRTGDLMGKKPNQGNSTETLNKRHQDISTTNKNVTSNYKGTRASKDRSHNTQTPQQQTSHK